MTKLKLFIIVSMVFSLVLSVNPILAKSKLEKTPDFSEVNVVLEWAAYDQDHAAVDYIIEGKFESPEGYLPINCPVSNVQIFNSAGENINASVFTSCRRLSADKFSMTQFFYSDFQSHPPEYLQISVGNVTLMPVADGEIKKMPLIGTFSFEGKFEEKCNITSFPNQVGYNNGVSMTVTRVDFTPKMVKIDACINLPDTKDWLPEAYIMQNGNRIQVSEWFIPNYKDDPEFFNRCERCYSFLAYVDIKDFRTIDSGMTSFGIGELRTSIPEAIDTLGLEKIKGELEKHGLKPRLDEYGLYAFSKDIADSRLSNQTKDQLFKYIENTLPERVKGPIEVTIH